MLAKTPDEIKKGLECCGKGLTWDETCGTGCPYEGMYITGCSMEISADALALIQQLQADNAQLNRCIENMTDKLNALNDEVAKLQAERDAAVETIYEMAKCITDDVCEWCDQTECERLCMMHATERPGFKWRGVQKEE